MWLWPWPDHCRTINVGQLKADLQALVDELGEDRCHNFSFDARKEGFLNGIFRRCPVMQPDKGELKEIVAVFRQPDFRIG